MAKKVPDSALRRMRGDHELGHDPNEPDIIAEQRRQVERATNPDFVTKTKGWISPEGRMRRKAVREALEGRLTIFRDNIEAIRTANRVMNNAAIVQVMTAAETYIVQIRNAAEVEKQDILFRSQENLMYVLANHLASLSKMREQEILPEELIEAREFMAYNEFAERAAKLAGLDFEFDKKKLLNLT
jgi:hypothetical protein